MKNQVCTSAGTSMNSRNLPSAFRRFQPVGTVLDWGCGKFYDKTRDFVLLHGATLYYPYDPYNIPGIENIRTLNYGFVVDTAYCCNVLNVIDSDDIVIDTIKSVCSRLALNGKAYFQIYEGNKSGVGSVTKNDCYQRNAKTEDYLYFFQFLPIRYKFERHSNYIVVIRRK